ncbi:MAG: C1 family peptidase, partial [Eubacterium sp.]|nr:C1 family peptidase [Eubacterium sp.]
MKKLIKLLSCSIITILGLILLTVSITATDEASISPPKGYVFPTQEEINEAFTIDEDAEIITEMPEITEIGKQRGLTNNPRLRAALPSSVDNSKLKYFPIVKSQGSLGSCLTFADVYYCYTYMYAMKHDIDVKTLGDKAAFSPAFSYRQSLNEFGPVTLEEMPYTPIVSNFKYPTEAKVYRDALSRKPEKSLVLFHPDLNIEYSESRLKENLANGYIFMFGIDARSFSFADTKRNPASSEDVPAGEKYLMASLFKSNHAMTLVGYNDNLWCDIDNDDIVDSGEMGAFKTANSWGHSFGNWGCVWIPYGHFKDICLSDHMNHIATSLPREVPYTPELLAEVEIELKDAVTVTIQPQSQKYDIKSLGSSSPNFMHGSYFNGSFVIDLTRAVKEINLNTANNRYEFYLGRSPYYTAPLTLKSYKLTDGSGNELAVGHSMPRYHNIDKSNYAIARISYGHTSQTGPWDIEFDPQNGEKPTIISAKIGDIISKDDVPDPIKEKDSFLGWENAYGEIVTLPYYIGGGDSLKAIYASDLANKVDIDSEILEVQNPIGYSVDYRQFKSKSGEFAIKESTPWKLATSYNRNGKTYINLSKLLDNSKYVMLQFRVGSSDKYNELTYYFLPRQSTVKLKLDPTAGMTDITGSAKMAVTGTVKSLIYREKTSDVAYTVSNQGGFIYLPVKGYKATYIVQTKGDNSGRDGLTFETALQPGSKP